MMPYTYFADNNFCLADNIEDYLLLAFNGTQMIVNSVQFDFRFVIHFIVCEKDDFSLTVHIQNDKITFIHTTYLQKYLGKGQFILHPDLDLSLLTVQALR